MATNITELLEELNEGRLVFAERFEFVFDEDDGTWSADIHAEAEWVAEMAMLLRVFLTLLNYGELKFEDGGNSAVLRRGRTGQWVRAA